MDGRRRPDRAALGVIALLLVATGPALGLVDLTPPEPKLGSGTATVVEAGVEGRLAIDQGRFGTGVVYVRPPRSTAVVDEVSGRPRLVYGVGIPGLGYDATASTLIVESGRYRLSLPDRGMPVDGVTPGTYEATTTLAVQSFTERRVVRERNWTVEVRG